MFDDCPLFSSLLVVLESSRQNHNRPTKLFCRYTRLAQARSSSGHENHLSSQVDKISRDEKFSVLSSQFSVLSSQVDKISRDEKRDKLASPDLIPGEKERRWVFLPRENFDSSQIMERLTVLQIFERLTNS